MRRCKGKVARFNRRKQVYLLDYYLYTWGVRKGNQEGMVSKESQVK